MRKNKTLAFALAASLLVGGTFVGTKALFTDVQQVAGELKISTGDVDIEVTDKVAPKWTITRNNGNYTEAEGTLDKDGDNKTFDNLKYGDKLTKTVNFENAGTLNALVSLDKDTNLDADINKLPEGIQFTAVFKQIDGKTKEETTLNLNEEVLFEPGDKGKVEFTIEVVEGGQHSKSEQTINSDLQEVKEINLNNAYTLNANQIGK